MQFDASIDITEAILPPGCTIPPDAVELVGAAIQALPGASWVSVEVCLGVPAGLPWIAVYRPGRSERLEGGPWDTVIRSVADAARNALRA